MHKTSSQNFTANLSRCLPAFIAAALAHTSVAGAQARLEIHNTSPEIREVIVESNVDAPVVSRQSCVSPALCLVSVRPHQRLRPVGLRRDLSRSLIDFEVAPQQDRWRAPTSDTTVIALGVTSGVSALAALVITSVGASTGWGGSSGFLSFNFAPLAYLTGISLGLVSAVGCGIGALALSLNQGE